MLEFSSYSGNKDSLKDKYNNRVLEKLDVPSFGGINLLMTLKSQNGGN